MGCQHLPWTVTNTRETALILGRHRTDSHTAAGRAPHTGPYAAFTVAHAGKGYPDSGLALLIPR